MIAEIKYSMEKLEDKISSRVVEKKIKNRQWGEKIKMLESQENSQLTNRMKKTLNKENDQTCNIRNISVYEIFLLIEHGNCVSNLMNKKCSPSHIILNYNGNYIGNKDPKSFQREKT